MGQTLPLFSRLQGFRKRLVKLFFRQRSTHPQTTATQVKEHWHRPNNDTTPPPTELRRAANVSSKRRTSLSSSLVSWGQTILPKENQQSTATATQLCTGGRALTEAQWYDKGHFGSSALRSQGHRPRYWEPYYSTTNWASQSSRCSQQVESSQKQSEENFTSLFPCVSGPGFSILLISQGRCIRSSKRIGFFINNRTWKSLLRQVRRGLLTIDEEIFETFEILETFKKSTWELSWE